MTDNKMSEVNKQQVQKMSVRWAETCVCVTGKRVQCCPFFMEIKYDSLLHRKYFNHMPLCPFMAVQSHMDKQ